MICILFIPGPPILRAPLAVERTGKPVRSTALMMDLDIGVVQDVEKRQKKRLLLDYLADNLKHHNWWAYRYFFCEFLALVNIIGKKHIAVFSTLQLFRSYLELKNEMSEWTNIRIKKYLYNFFRSLLLKTTT